MSHGLDLSVIIPAFEEGQLLSTLLPDLQQVLGGLDITSELLIVTRDRDPLTTAAAERAGARLIAPAARTATARRSRPAGTSRAATTS